MDVKPIEKNLNDIRQMSIEKYNNEFSQASDGNLVVKEELANYELLLQKKQAVNDLAAFRVENEELVTKYDNLVNNVKNFGIDPNPEKNVVYGEDYTFNSENNVESKPEDILNNSDNFNTVYGPISQPVVDEVENKPVVEDFSQMVESVVEEPENNNIEEELNNTINEVYAEEDKNTNSELVEEIMKLIKGYEALAEHDSEEALLKIDALKLKLTESSLPKEEYDKVMNELNDLENKIRQNNESYQKTLVNVQ